MRWRLELDFIYQLNAPITKIEIIYSTCFLQFLFNVSVLAWDV